jgi:uncharacterized membrane protein
VDDSFYKPLILTGRQGLLRLRNTKQKAQKPVGKWLLLLPLLFAAIGLPMALQMVPPNVFYGIRTSETLASEQVWYAANYWAGVVAIILGLPATAANLAIARTPSLSEVQKHLFPVVTLIFVTVAMAAAGLSAA